MKDRFQSYDPERKKYVKYNVRNGEEMQAKQDGKPFQRIPEFFRLIPRK